MRCVALIALAVAACTPSVDRDPARSHVPREMAGADTLVAMRDWSALPVWGSGTYRMQSSEDRDRGVKERLALWERGNRDFNNFVCRGRQTDAPTSREPFVVDVDVCPESHVRGMVMARFEGKGRLARLWMTAASIRNAAPDDELLRIYVDESPNPLVEVPLADMLGGGASEMFAPPFGAGSRRYVAWHYPVAFARKIIVSLDGLAANDLYFHQTAVVLDEGSSPLAKPSARKKTASFLEGRIPDSASMRRHHVALAPGAKRVIEVSGPATIVNATLEARHADLHNVHLTVHWDDSREPAIAVPVGELFAAWDAPVERSSLALSAHVDGDTMTTSLRLPMPFRRHARWTLHNQGDDPVALSLGLGVRPGTPSASFGHLTVQRNLSTSPVARHPLASASGRGRLVGVCMALHGHGMTERNRRGHPFHFLEGDELGIVDGERVMAGTGTEDYFNGAFYFEDGPRGTPFAQVWDITPRIPATPDRGRVSTCRWHVLTDAIDFARSLELDMEVGPGASEVLDRYASVAFVYR